MHYPKLSKEASRELLVAAKSGDAAARERFLLSYVPFVRAIARRRGRYQELDDLTQEGALGLMKALDKYDLARINPATGRPFEFSTYAHWWVRDAMDQCRERPMRSLNEPLKGGELGAMIAAPVPETFDAELGERVRNAVLALHPKRREVIVRHYWFDQSFTDIGNELGTSRMAPSRSEARALKELRYELKRAKVYLERA
ncbi:sigma-70 family RNA polymerase sigma factor [Candidatus Woesearchaeota archaeon]|nr:sigma-70 family RNA polymerase sigma factor [Candidatus Woesearchaeota archaeon]